MGKRGEERERERERERDKLGLSKMMRKSFNNHLYN